MIELPAIQEPPFLSRRLRDIHAQAEVKRVDLPWLDGGKGQQFTLERGVPDPSSAEVYQRVRLGQVTDRPRLQIFVWNSARG